MAIPVTTILEPYLLDKTSQATEFEKFGWVSGSENIIRIKFLIHALQSNAGAIMSVKDVPCAIHFDGLEQERRNSIADAVELRLSCTNPLIYQACCWPSFPRCTQEHEVRLCKKTRLNTGHMKQSINAMAHANLVVITGTNDIS